MRALNDILYYTARLEKERALAIAATSPAARAAHAELAAEYEALARNPYAPGIDREHGMRPSQASLSSGEHSTPTS
jgi:hypothetical protein